MKPFKNIESLNRLPWTFQEALSEIREDIVEIQKLNPDQIMRDKCQWELGDPFWWNTIKNWAENAGFTIEFSDEEE